MCPLPPPHRAARSTTADPPPILERPPPPGRDLTTTLGFTGGVVTLVCPGAYASQLPAVRLRLRVSPWLEIYTTRPRGSRGHKKR